MYEDELNSLVRNNFGLSLGGGGGERTWICLEKKQIDLSPQFIRIRAFKFIELIETVTQMLKETRRNEPSFHQGKT